VRSEERAVRTALVAERRGPSHRGQADVAPNPAVDTVVDRTDVELAADVVQHVVAHQIADELIHAGRRSTALPSQAVLCDGRRSGRVPRCRRSGLRVERADETHDRRHQDGEHDPVILHCAHLPMSTATKRISCGQPPEGGRTRATLTLSVALRVTIFITSSATSK
jgi:hypothetical protein